MRFSALKIASFAAATFIVSCSELKQSNDNDLKNLEELSGDKSSRVECSGSNQFVISKARLQSEYSVQMPADLSAAFEKSITAIPEGMQKLFETHNGYFITASSPQAYAMGKNVTILQGTSASDYEEAMILFMDMRNIDRAQAAKILKVELNKLPQYAFLLVFKADATLIKQISVRVFAQFLAEMPSRIGLADVTQNEKNAMASEFLKVASSFNESRFAAMSHMLGANAKRELQNGSDDLCCSPLLLAKCGGQHSRGNTHRTRHPTQDCSVFTCHGFLALL